MMFDTEVWPIVATESRGIYCGVMDNRVSVHPESGGEYAAFIRIPSDLFYFLWTVGGISLAQIKKEPVSLYLDQVNGEWFFGLESREDSIDLWKYKQLPGWAKPDAI